jgi:predicted enzyme related to lactoylglutathione lyase
MSITAKMVTIDCEDPRTLAAWWVEAVGGTITQDFEGWFVVVRAATVDLGFQKVDTERQGKNRVHVDFAADDRDAEVRRLVGMGATKVDEHTLPNGFSWTVLRDPMGNEFCVST